MYKRQLVGWVTDRDCLDLVRKGEKDLRSIVRTDHGAVSSDTALSELFIPSLEYSLALGVVDDKNRLVGVIPRVTLLATLGGEPGAAAQAIPDRDPIPTHVVDQALEAAVHSGSLKIEEVN